MNFWRLPGVIFPDLQQGGEKKPFGEDATTMIQIYADLPSSKLT